MKAKLKKYFVSAIAILGTMSCATLETTDKDLQNILLGKASSKKYIRTSLDRSKTFSVKAPPVKLAKSKPTVGLKLKDSPEISKYISLYTKSKRRDIEVPLEKRAEHIPVIEAVLEYYDIPLELSNLAFVESKFDTSATSPRGAKGIWQLMKPTAEGLGLSCRFWNDERKDVLRSSIAAARYIKELEYRFGDWLLAVAAYNAGPGRVEAAQMRSGKTKDFFTLAKKGLLPKETVAHVYRFIALTKITQKPELYGFSGFDNAVGDMPIVD